MWLGKMIALNMTPLGWLGSKTSTQTNCALNITWKIVFCLAFYFKWIYFVLINHILSDTVCLFYFCVLFSNIYLKFTHKNWSDLFNFYCKMIFFYFLFREIFFLFFWWFLFIIAVSWQLKISEKNNWNLLKPSFQFAYPINFGTICNHFYY